MALSTSLILKFKGTQVAKGLAMVRKSFTGLGKAGMTAGRMMLAPFAKLMAMMAPLLGFAAVAKIGSDALKSASEIESLTSQFRTLLGGQDKAVDRMDKLQQFAAETPFEIAELSRASKQLEVAGGEALSMGDGLRMVGDAAALAGEPIGEVATHIGRMFTALTSGTSAGESTNRLMELALISGEAKLEFEGLAAAQKKGTAPIMTNAQALARLQVALAKSAGSMRDLSATTEGKFSNLKDSWSQLLVAFGTPINDALRPLMDKLSAKFGELRSQAKNLGEQVGSAITVSFNAFKNGELGTLIKDAFMFGVIAAGEYLIGIMSFVGNQLANKIKETISAIKDDSVLGKAGKLVDAASSAVLGDFGKSSDPKSSPFDKTELSLADAIAGTRGILGSAGRGEMLGATVRRNQTELVRMQPEADVGMVMKLIETSRLQLEALKGINQKLSPQP